MKPLPLLLSLVLAGSAAAQPQPRQRPWEMSPDEHASQRAAALRRHAVPGDPVVTITGREDAAAILPVELFTHVVRFYLVHPPQPAMLRHIRSSELLRRDEDWAELIRLTSAYADLIRRGDWHDPNEKAAAVPRLRGAEASAFRAVRAHFGRERFDQFLYTAVAPGFFMTFPKAPDANDLREVVAREKAAQ